MKKWLVVVAVSLIVTWTAAAQYGAGQTSTAPQSEKSKAASAASGEAKETHLTGCLSKEANADGAYTLTSGKSRAVEVGPADQVKEHAGHKVKLTGSWEKSGAAIGEQETKNEKGERHFMVTKVEHISDTCTASAAGEHKSHKSKGMENPKS